MEAKPRLATQTVWWVEFLRLMPDRTSWWVLRDLADLVAAIRAPELSIGDMRAVTRRLKLAVCVGHPA